MRSWCTGCCPPRRWPTRPTARSTFARSDRRPGSPATATERRWSSSIAPRSKRATSAWRARCGFTIRRPTQCRSSGTAGSSFVARPRRATCSRSPASSRCDGRTKCSRPSASSSGWCSSSRRCSCSTLAVALGRRPSVIGRRMGLGLGEEATAIFVELVVPFVLGAFIGFAAAVVIVHLAIGHLDTLRNLEPPARVVVDLDEHRGRSARRDGGLARARGHRDDCRCEGEADGGDAQCRLSPLVVVRGDRLTRRFTTPAGTVIALDDVDVEMMAGSLTVVAGPSGSGKSVLLSMISCTDRPTRRASASRRCPRHGPGSPGASPFPPGASRHRPAATVRQPPRLGERARERAVGVEGASREGGRDAARRRPLDR